MAEEEKDAYDTCQQTNDIVFEYLLPSKDCKALSKVAFYLLDQGLRAKISKEHFASEANSEEEKEEDAGA